MKNIYQILTVVFCSLVIAIPVANAQTLDLATKQSTQTSLSGTTKTVEPSVVNQNVIEEPINALDTGSNVTVEKIDTYQVATPVDVVVDVDQSLGSIQQDVSVPTEQQTGIITTEVTKDDLNAALTPSDSKIIVEADQSDYVSMPYGTLTGESTLDASYYAGTVLQEVYQGDLKFSVQLVEHADGRTKVILKTQDGKRFLLGKDLFDAGVNLKNVFIEGAEHLVKEKTFYSLLKLPTIYALTNEANKPSQLVALFLYDEVQNSNAVDMGLVEQLSHHAFLTPADKHIRVANSRFNYSYEILFVSEKVTDGNGRAVIVDLSELIYDSKLKGTLVQGLKTRYVSESTYPVKGTEFTYNGVGDDMLVAWVADKDGADQVMLLHDKAGQITTEFITNSMGAKVQPGIHYTQGAVSYSVKDELTGINRVAMHIISESKQGVTYQSCPEYYITSADLAYETIFSNHYFFPSPVDPFGKNLNTYAYRALQVCEGEQPDQAKTSQHLLNVSSAFRQSVMEHTCDDNTKPSEAFVGLVQPALVDAASTASAAVECGQTETKVVDCGSGLVWDEKSQSCIVPGGSPCQEGYVKLLDGTCGPAQPACDKGYYYDANKQSCQPETIQCGEGYQLNATQTACEPIAKVVIDCEEGSYLNAAGDACVYVAECPEDTIKQVSVAGVVTCVYEVEGCEDDMILVDNLCVYETADCPEGTTLNANLNVCEYDLAPCADGSTLDPSTNSCVYPTLDASCPAGSKLDQKQQVCILPAVCPQGSIYNVDTKTCVYKAQIADCPKGTELINNQCAYPIAECEDGFVLNQKTNQCEAEQIDCPIGTTLTKQGCLKLPEVDDCMDDLAIATTKVGRLEQAANCQKPIEQQCPKGTLVGYKGECYPVVSKPTVNITAATRVINIYECCNCESAETGETECPEGYETDAENNACYQLIEDQTGFQTGVVDVVDDVNTGDSALEAFDALSGDAFAGGGSFCSLNTAATQHPAGSIGLMAMALLAFIRGVTRLKQAQTQARASK